MTLLVRNAPISAQLRAGATPGFVGGAGAGALGDAVLEKDEQRQFGPRLRRLLQSPGQADVSPVLLRLWHEHLARGHERPVKPGRRASRPRPLSRSGRGQARRLLWRRSAMAWQRAGPRIVRSLFVCAVARPEPGTSRVVFSASRATRLL